MLYRLREWSGETAARQWVAKLIESDDGLLAFLGACTTDVLTQTYGDQTATKTSKIHLKFIADLSSIDEVERRVSSIQNIDLSDDDRRRMEMLKVVIAQQRAGVSEDSLDDDSLDAL
jgi:hypothetical protein